MKSKFKKLVKEILKLSIILIIAMNIISYFKSTQLNKENLAINEFKLLENSKYTIKDNKPLVIHFWATWCPICKIEASNIQKLSKDYNVITIAAQSGTNEDIKKYMKENNVDFKVVNDKDGYYSKKFNIEVFPTTLIYNDKKVLKFSEVGYTSTLGLYLRVWYSKLF